MTVMLVPEVTTMLVPDVPPKVTAVALVKFVPVIVTERPPLVAPELGETEVMTGADAADEVSVEDGLTDGEPVVGCSVDADDVDETVGVPGGLGTGEVVPGIGVATGASPLTAGIADVVTGPDSVAVGAHADNSRAMAQATSAILRACLTVMGSPLS